MKQDSSSIDLITDTFKLSAGERRQLLASEKGEGLLIALGAHIAFRVEASPDEHALATTDPRELEQLHADARRAVQTSSPSVTAATAPSQRADLAGSAHWWVPSVPSAFVAMQAGNAPAADPPTTAAPSSPDMLLHLPTRFFRRSTLAGMSGPAEPDSARATDETEENEEEHHANGTSDTQLS